DHGKLTETIMETSTRTSSPGRGESAGSKATQFRPGHPGRRKIDDEYIEPEQDGAPDYLQTLRHVNLNPKAFDKTEPQRTARAIKLKDPAKFVALLAAEERAHKATLGTVGCGPGTQGAAVRDI